jgi:hypothetical protein
MVQNDHIDIERKQLAGGLNEGNVRWTLGSAARRGVERRRKARVGVDGNWL